jgi:hypothetical protein
MSVLACSQSVKRALPSATFWLRSSKISLCQPGDSTEPALRARSSHKASSASNFSRSVMSFRGKCTDLRRVYTVSKGLDASAAQLPERFLTVARACIRRHCGRARNTSSRPCRGARPVATGRERKTSHTSSALPIARIGRTRFGLWPVLKTCSKCRGLRLPAKMTEVIKASQKLKSRIAEVKALCLERTDSMEAFPCGLKSAI